MLVYSIMLLVTVLFTELYDNREKLFLNKTKKKSALKPNILFALACLPSAVVSAIRFEVGTDYGWVYWVGYLGVTDHPDDNTIARSYKPICQFLSRFSESPIPFFVISSCLICFAVFWYIRITNEKITLPVLVFFIAGLWFDSLNVIRQYMAISVWLFAYPYMRDRRLAPYLFISALAALIHPTAVVLLPFYVLCGIRLTRWRFVAVGGALIVGALLVCRLMPEVLVHIPKYSRYVDWLPDPELSGTVFALLLTAAALMLYPRLQEGTYTDFLLWSLLLYDGTVLLSYFLPAMGRVMLYFEIPVFVNLLPSLLVVLPSARKMLASGAAIGLLLCTTIYMNYYLDQSDVFPYRTVFDVTRMEDYMADSDDVLQLFLRDDLNEESAADGHKNTQTE